MIVEVSCAFIRLVAASIKSCWTTWCAFPQSVSTTAWQGTYVAPGLSQVQGCRQHAKTSLSMVWRRKCPKKSPASNSPASSLTGVAPPPAVTQQQPEVPRYRSQDADFLDASRSVGNLTLLRQTGYSRFAGVRIAFAPLPFSGLEFILVATFGEGREAYLLIAKNKGELVLVQEFLSVLRNRRRTLRLQPPF